MIGMILGPFVLLFFVMGAVSLAREYRKMKYPHATRIGGLLLFLLLGWVVSAIVLLLMFALLYSMTWSP